MVTKQPTLEQKIEAVIGVLMTWDEIQESTRDIAKQIVEALDELSNTGAD